MTAGNRKCRTGGDDIVVEGRNGEGYKEGGVCGNLPSSLLVAFASYMQRRLAVCSYVKGTK